MKTCNLFFVALICLSCLKDKSEEIQIIRLEKVYVSYFPSGANYDIDSIKVRWVDIAYIDKIDKITVYLKDTSQFTPQKIVLRDSVNFINSVWNGAAKPFWWEDPYVDSFSLPLDSVRRYLKNYIKEHNIFVIYAKPYGKQTITLNDTNVIVLEELYGGNDLIMSR